MLTFFPRMAAAIIFFSAGTVLAVPPSDTLLPETTKGYVSIADVQALIERWNEAPLGRLLNDASMKPFTDDLRRQLKEKWAKSHARLGIAIADLEGLATGEVAIAIVMPKEGRASLIVLADVTGKEKEAAATLAKIAANLRTQGAKASRQKQHGVEMSIFETTPKDHREHPFTTVHYIKGGLFVASDNPSLAGDIAGRLDTPQKHTLSTLPAYTTVVERCQKADAKLAPDMRWFVEPVGLAEALRTWETNRRKGGTDYLKVAKNQGFGAVKGVGGHVNLALGQYGMLHRTFIYAPPPYELAMRMAVFPNGGTFTPQDWVARDVSNYFSFQVDIMNAFNRFDTLFDEIYGEKGVWKDTLEGIEDDPNGPQINLQNDIVQHLGQRATVIADYELPITPTSQRKLLAVETTNAEKLAAAIEKSMTGDDRVRKLEIEGHDVWEIIPEDESMPALEIDDAGGGGKAPAEDSDEERVRQVKLSNSAVTVANGQLMVSSHIELLREVLAGVPKAEQLANDRDYQKVLAAAAKLGSGNDCAQGFARTDEQYRVMYELFKQGRLPEADTFLAHFINFLMGEEKEGVTRQARLDGSKLPDYKLVQHYLGPGGSFSASEDEGWLLVGFTVADGAQLANEARAAKTK